VWDVVGELDWQGLVRARQRLDVQREFPVAGRGCARTTVTDLHDKGPAAIVATETTLTCDNGEGLATGRGVLTSARGGWGGDRGRLRRRPSTRRPHGVALVPTDPRQALLDRINEDRTASPRSHLRPGPGLDRPIVHELCTIGIALRSVVALVDPAEQRAIRSAQTRLARRFRWAR
jgi:hypothetical protein